ncbi:MAG TPA: 4-hydroxy-tetrahydrodipicolinate reductase [Acidimicrobiales bacterium]|nr:4-hydroxy-tetrahydrodipicolinate reductase [Acidimicrobiales bacterium]
MTTVAVLGAGGRMGREVCRAVAGDPELSLVAAVDPSAAGRRVGELAGVAGEAAGLVVAAGLDAVGEAGAEVAVDFTVAASAAANLAWCAGRGVHAVVGTTGLGPDSLDELAAAFAASEANCIVAANFAVTAVLMMRFAELAAPFVDSVEIIELHHNAKIDAPSGTALATAARIAAARARAGDRPWAPDATVTELAGARGAAVPGGIRVHSVRLPGLVAHQEVIMGAAGQGLSIRHDAYDRTSFMPGVVLAVKAVRSLPGLTVGLDAVLGF